jgi:hypothetical protein
MKYFNSYITEIFDRAYPWQSWDCNTNSIIPYCNYELKAVKLAGSSNWIPDPGPAYKRGVPMATGTLERLTQDYLKANPGLRQRIVVGFSQYRGTEALTSQRRVNRGLKGQSMSLPVFESLWELGFATYIDTDGSGWDKGTDDDLGGEDTAHVTRIFGSIIQIVRDFKTKKKPQGIFWGTKPNARPARAVIYNNIARRLSGELGAQLYSMPSPRPEMTNCQLAWWGSDSPFEPRKPK